jgi:hypothetical protein
MKRTLQAWDLAQAILDIADAISEGHDFTKAQAAYAMVDLIATGGIRPYFGEDGFLYYQLHGCEPFDAVQRAIWQGIKDAPDEFAVSQQMKQQGSPTRIA